MLELILLFVLALTFLVVFGVWALSRWRSGVELPPALVAQLTEFVPLSGVSYERAEQLFDPRDYYFLLGRPRLEQAARQLERDRRQAALLWLGLVREDFGKLRQFHRILVACGASTDVRTECRLLTSIVSFHFLHSLLALWIRVFGLYAAPRAHTALLGSVRQVSTLVANVFAHLTPSQVAQVKQLWAVRRLTPSLAK